MSELYAVVDLSKKKIKKPALNQNEQSKDSDIMMYDILNKDNIEKDKIKLEKKPSDLHKKKCNLCNITTTGGFQIFITITNWIVLLITIVMVITLFVKFSTMDTSNASTNSLQQQANPEYNSTLLKQIINRAVDVKYVEFVNKQMNFQLNIRTLLKNLSMAYGDTIDEMNYSINFIHDSLNNISLATQLALQKESISHYFSSCSQILAKDALYKSGKYIVRTSSGALRRVHCDMTNQFGNNSQGWMRIAKLDANNCPEGLKFRRNATTKTCIVFDDNAGCTTLVYSTLNVQYTKVTGKIRGYQIGTLDGFVGISGASRSSDNYVDGVTITANDMHVWTYAAGQCDCAGMRPEAIDNYFTCDKHAGCVMRTFCNTYLWESPICGGPHSQWFLRTLPPTSADIRVSICRDQKRNDEDLAISTLELYVQ